MARKTDRRDMRRRKSGSINLCSAILVVILMVLSFFVSVLFYSASTFTPHSPIATIQQDTIEVADTVCVLGNGFQLMLQHSYFLNVCNQRIIIPFDQTVEEAGIAGAIVSIFTDVTLNMFCGIPVEIKAGIDASDIRIEDYSFGSDNASVSYMLISIPRAQITSSRVDYTEIQTHFNEGHLRGTADRILEFITEAVDAAENQAVDLAITAGILEEANEKCIMEITNMLRSTGIQEVEVVFQDTYIEVSLIESVVAGRKK